MTRILSLGGVLVFAAALAWLLFRPDGRRAPTPSLAAGDPRTNDSNGTQEPRPRDGAASDSRHTAEQAGEPAEQGMVLAVTEPEHGEDPDSRRWDELDAKDRRVILERNLHEAMSQARDGLDVARNLARAESTLSALRPELVITESGVRRYGKLEAELDELSTASHIAASDTASSRRRRRDP